MTETTRKPIPARTESARSHYERQKRDALANGTAAKVLQNSVAIEVTDKDAFFATNPPELIDACGFGVGTTDPAPAKRTRKAKKS